LHAKGEHEQWYIQIGLGYIESNLSDG
jgi:hypothetical protein